MVGGPFAGLPAQEVRFRDMREIGWASALSIELADRVKDSENDS